MEGNEAPEGFTDDDAVTPVLGPDVAADSASSVESQPEPEPEPTMSALVADTCSAMLDAVVVIDRITATQDAWKVEFLDQARRIAELTDHGLVTVGSTLTETQQREMVRRSFVAEVACLLRVPEVTAGRLIDDSAVLMSRLPATLSALRAGDITLRHARVIVDQVATLNDDNTLALEEAALPYAKTLTVSKFTQKARVLRERIDADSITERRVKSAEARRVEFLPAADGMAWLNLYTTAPEATSLYTAIRSAALQRQSRTETRTLTQLGADVCADALAAGLVGDTAAPAIPGTAFGRIQPTVLVTVPAMTLLGVSDEPGDLAGYGPIDPDTARKLAGTSKTWYRLLTDPETGALLSLGRTKYKPTKQMRDYLVLRDGTCRWEGCNRQAKHCELDHTDAWEFGGPTDCDNLSHLCPKHHRLKHQTTWTAEQLPGGVIRWTSPDGRSYVTEPDVRLPLPAPVRAGTQPRPGSPPPNPPTAPPTAGPAPPGTHPDPPPPF